MVYILVVSEDKNKLEADKMEKCQLAGVKYQPEYMKKLENIFSKKHMLIHLNYWKEILSNVLSISKAVK